MRKYIEIGKIVNTHGVHGSVKVDPWCDTPQVLAQMKKVYLSPLAKGEAYRELTVLKGSVQKYHVLLTLEGIDTFDAAEAMKNTLLFADRDDIPIAEGAFLIDDHPGRCRRSLRNPNRERHGSGAGGQGVCQIG